MLRLMAMEPGPSRILRPEFPTVYDSVGTGGKALRSYQPPTPGLGTLPLAMRLGRAAGIRLLGKNVPGASGSLMGARPEKSPWRWAKDGTRERTGKGAFCREL